MMGFPSMFFRSFLFPGVGDRRAETYRGEATEAVDQSTPKLFSAAPG
jgi:hypothetical protein